MPTRDADDDGRSDAYLAAILDHAPIAITLRDEQLSVVAFNRQAEAWSGLAPQSVLGRTYEEIDAAMAEVNRAADQEVLTRGVVVRNVRSATVMARRSGVEMVERVAFPLRAADGAIVGIGSLNFDVTQQTRLERQLAQVSKTEAMGRMAGQIAHDFNNVIGAIQGYADLLREELDAPTEQLDLVERILTSSAIATDLVQRLLRFARSSQPEPRLMDLRDGIEVAKVLVEPLMPPTVTVSWRLPREACWVVADPVQIQQVVLNLCVNARDAIQGARGAIDVTCRRCSTPPGSDATVGASASGSAASALVGQLDGGRCYGVISVTDTGSGMDQETLDQVFEPFFTTKPLGTGTGLGLGIVQGAVVSADGALTVASKRGEGTTFTIYWPLAPDAPPAPAVG